MEQIIELCTLATDIQDDGTARAKCLDGGREITVHSELFLGGTKYVAGVNGVAVLSAGKYHLIGISGCGNE